MTFDLDLKSGNKIINEISLFTRNIEKKYPLTFIIIVIIIISFSNNFRKNFAKFHNPARTMSV